MVDLCRRSPNLWSTFVNHNHSWLLKIWLGEDNNSSTLEPTPIHVESAQLSRVIGTRTLTQNYYDAKPLSKFGLLIFLSVDLKFKSLGEGLLKTIFSEISSWVANGQCWSGVAIYSCSLPWWKLPNWTCGAANGRTTKPVVSWSRPAKPKVPLQSVSTW